MVVLEAADAIGGRVRTDRVDGFTLDRGFQLYNPAYPEGRLAWPDLRDPPVLGGVDVVRDGISHPLADPRRDPRSLPATTRSLRALGATRGLAAFASYAARLGTPAHPRRTPPGKADQGIGEALRAAGVDEAAPRLPRAAVPVRGAGGRRRSNPRAGSSTTSCGPSWPGLPGCLTRGWTSCRAAWPRASRS